MLRHAIIIIITRWILKRLRRLQQNSCCPQNSRQTLATKTKTKTLFKFARENILGFITHMHMTGLPKWYLLSYTLDDLAKPCWNKQQLLSCWLKNQPFNKQEVSFINDLDFVPFYTLFHVIILQFRCKKYLPNSPLIFKIQSEKTPKRHQLSMAFHVFLGFWAQKPKNTRKSHWKLMSFQCLLDWILKMRGL